MGVHVHPGSPGLFQQQGQVPQVVAGDQNARVVPDLQGDPGLLRRAEGPGVGPVQQGHTPDAEAAGLQDQGSQLVGRQPVVQGGGQGLLKEGVQLLVLLPQHIGVLGIGRQALQAVEDQLPQGADVLHHVLPAVPVGEPAELQGVPRRAAVAQVVVAHDGEAVLRQEAGEGVIPADVFRDAVDQLHHPPGRPLRPPPGGGNCVDPIAGGKGKFLFDHHGNPAPFVIE